MSRVIYGGLALARMLVGDHVPRLRACLGVPAPAPRTAMRLRTGEAPPRVPAQVPTAPCLTERVRAARADRRTAQESALDHMRAGLPAPPEGGPAPSRRRFTGNAGGTVPQPPDLAAAVRARRKGGQR